jgi:hypothetical protein
MRRKPFGAAIRWSVRIWIVCAGAALAVRLAAGAAAFEPATPNEAGLPPAASSNAFLK